ncbi:MAG TPA: carbamate kinase, partial [Sedimentibacter sp.]|nr:carbamate kinase [Sedimentibacter sp.]
MSNIIVLALGGNALGNDPQEQKEAVKHTSKSIVDLIEAGNQVILSHGNGPQVGMINLAMDAASKSEAGTPEMPFPECGAMSQGYIGYHLQNAIQNELKLRGIKKSVATVVTQVVVDKNDPAFQNPTKPVGSFYTKEEAELMTAKGF